ncbi:DNA methyltransferase [Calothrix sp. PCC 7507]|uniref:DNA methyltransferase n=1 Tax=Calothrix sp. PCC 7507 TaxID=99598 RepID=UPI00029EF542|nr:DNA methyltransferase [Calothrix sp. PCC 7507]AFY31185.1 DNA methylase N-4/N-6 domain protein [Calothrix sp. PCC 7507]
MTKPYQLQLFNSTPESHENIQSRIIKERTGTFTDNMKLPIHRWFRYSAGFSAAWVEGVITELEPKIILDPFAGSGTVCVAADKLGVTSYGIEAHPFVHRLAKGKLAWVVHIHEFLEAANKIKHSAAMLQPKLPEKIPILLSKCYTEETLTDLLRIKQAYLELAPFLSEEVQSLIFLAICAILRSTSYVGTAQWQYILPNKRKAKTGEPFEALEKQVAMMQEDMCQMQSITRSSLSTLVQDDARSLKSLPDNLIDLVITSPPYANNYDYADATRLEMTFWGEVNSWGDLHETVRKFLVRSSSQHVSKERLNLDSLIAESIIEPIRDELLPVCQELANIRGTKGGNKAYHTMIAAYFTDMAFVFRALRRVASSNCKICFVVGDSAPYGVYVPVEQWLGKLAIAAGFDFWSFDQIRQRNVKWKNRKHNVPLQEGRLWIEGECMAQSPSHKFGQDLGKLLEDIVEYDILKPRLQQFAQTKNYYLDWQRSRPARSGKKVTWEDKYGNKHDLDFVIEIDGTDDQIGRPVAFIESAWRRYTKHSKNKAQEIQGAILPIIELHHLSAPFYGAILAGDFTKPALDQLRNNGFTIIYIPYKDVVAAFKEIDFDIEFDEETPDESYTEASKKLAALTTLDKEKLRQALMRVSKQEVDRFMDTLRNCLERYITKVILVPLFGIKYEFERIDDAIAGLNTLNVDNPSGEFERFEVIVDYSNSDTIRASFQTKTLLADFLRKLGS